LFDCSTDNIGLHLKNIFATGELEKDAVTEKISATASDGKNMGHGDRRLTRQITGESGEPSP